MTAAFQFFCLFLLQCMTFISYSSRSQKENDCFLRGSDAHKGEEETTVRKGKYRKSPEAKEVWHTMCLYL